MPKDHPNSAPGVPMLFPAWVDRIQLKYMNPAVRRVARFLPTFAVVKHRGRKSGRQYETVVNAYRKRRLLAILLGHGKADWVKNILAAGEADVRVNGRDLRITNPRIVPRRHRRERTAVDCPDGRSPGGCARRGDRLKS